MIYYSLLSINYTDTLFDKISSISFMTNMKILYMNLFFPILIILRNQWLLILGDIIYGKSGGLNIIIHNTTFTYVYKLGQLDDPESFSSFSWHMKLVQILMFLVLKLKMKKIMKTKIILLNI